MSSNSQSKTGLKILGPISLALPAAAIFALVASAPAIAGEAAAHFTDSCADCHGKDGKGDGPKAAELKTKPRNYTDCAGMSKITDDYMLKIIKEGGEKVGKSKEMPDFASAYDDGEIKELVEYVRTFCKK
ncbi:MAG TPA: cytochrome c [Candidatus Binataceae bacterium]|nr:cytochrome c [Candidatus Binataceae bacterium]